MSNQKNSVFSTLSSVAIKDKVERKGNIDYLSWAYAWSLLKQHYPTAQRVVYEDPATGWNYFSDGRTAWVKVGVIVEEQEHIDYLPIMDFRNQAIPVDRVNQFEVNKAIQRSTAKAIAMHGLAQVQYHPCKSMIPLDKIFSKYFAPAYVQQRKNRV